VLSLNLVAATDRILLVHVHHLRHVSACSLDTECHLAAIEMKSALVDSDQRPVGDDAVDLGDPLHDPDHYLRGLRVAVYGLVVVGMEQLFVPDVEE